MILKPLSTGLLLALGLLAAPVQDTRTAIPDAAALKDAEKAVKDVFKAEYARKGAADKATLAKLLLQSATSQSNPAERWVCLAQAQEVAAQAGEWDVAWDAIVQSAIGFQCDGLTMKVNLLAQAAKTAKTPEDAARLTERYCRVADEAIKGDSLEVAEKAAAAAQQMSKKSASVPLNSQATAKAKEVSDVKAGFEKSRKARETLTKTPEDPAANQEYGLYLCMTKGQWDLGLPLLAKGPDGPYKTIATRELAAPESAADQSSIGDFWWELSEKETGAAKSSARNRALFWYALAFPKLEGLVKVRTEKRMTDAEIAQNGYIDLLRMIDPAQDSVATTWKLDAGVLTNGMNFRSRLQIPYQPPEEYDLTYVLATAHDGNPMIFGLVAGPVQFNVALEGWGRHIISAAEKKEINPPFTKALNYGVGDALGKDNTIVISVRKKGFNFTVNGTKSVAWEGPYAKLANPSDWAVPNLQALYIGAWDRPLQIRKIALTPVSGQGKRLR